MTFQWSAVTIDCTDPHRLADFWSALLPGERSVPLPGWVRLHPAGLPAINFQPVPEAKATKARLHLDLRVEDIDVAVATVHDLGGRTLARHDYDEGAVVVLADPEGTEFCLVQYY